MPSDDSRVCSTHFLEGKPTISNPYPSITLGYVPIREITSRPPPKLIQNIETPSKKRKSQTFSSETFLDPNNEDKAEFISNNDHAYYSCSTNRVSCLQKDIKITELQTKLEKCEHELQKYKTQAVHNNSIKTFNINKVLKSDKKLKFYTGIPTIIAFNEIFDSVQPHLKNIKYWKGPKRLCNPLKSKRKFCNSKRSLSAREEMILCLMKLRLGLLNEDLSDRFDISVGLVSSVFTTWVKILSRLLGECVFNPPAEVVRANLPPSFRNNKFQNVRHIIDCTEALLKSQIT